MNNSIEFQNPPKKKRRRRVMTEKQTYTRAGVIGKTFIMNFWNEDFYLLYVKASPSVKLQGTDRQPPGPFYLALDLVTCLTQGSFVFWAGTALPRISTARGFSKNSLFT
jgi:hypothetical protein